MPTPNDGLSEPLKAQFEELWKRYHIELGNTPTWKVLRKGDAEQVIAKLILAYRMEREKEVLEVIEVNLGVLRNTYGKLDGGKVAGARWLSEVIKDHLESGKRIVAEKEGA